MKQVLRALLASRPHYQWLTVLYMVEVAINNAPIANTEFSPYYLNYGFHPVFKWDVPPTETSLPITQRLEPLHTFHQRMFEALQHRAVIQANKRRSDYQFEVGQQVLVSQRRHFRTQLGPSGPLAPRAAGPFTITRKLTTNTFALDIPASTLGRASPVFHSSDLIPYASRLLEPEAGVDSPDFDELMLPTNPAYVHPLPENDDIVVLTDPFSNPNENANQSIPDESDELLPDEFIPSKMEDALPVVLDTDYPTASLPEGNS